MDGSGGGWSVRLDAGVLYLAPGIVRRPAEAPPYVIAYGGAALLLGLVVGLVGDMTAILVLKFFNRMAHAVLYTWCPALQRIFESM